MCSPKCRQRSARRVAEARFQFGHDCRDCRKMFAKAKPEPCAKHFDQFYQVTRRAWISGRTMFT